MYEVPRVEGQNTDIVCGVECLLLLGTGIVFWVADASIVFDVEVEFRQVEIGMERSGFSVLVD